jgi:hypothetical protein
VKITGKTASCFRHWGENDALRDLTLLEGFDTNFVTKTTS